MIIMPIIEKTLNRTFSAKVYKQVFNRIDYIDNYYDCIGIDQDGIKWQWTQRIRVKNNLPIEIENGMFQKVI